MKVFTKHVQGDSREIFDRYLLFYKKVLSSDEIFFPKPLKIEGSTLHLEHLDFEQTLHNRLLNSKYLEARTVLRRVGYLLGKLHTLLNNEVVEGKIIIHGDFWAGNILLYKNKYFIIDPEPPKFLEPGEHQQYKYNYNYIDLATFIVKYETAINFKRLNMVSVFKKKATEEFLCGYTDATNFSIDKELLDNYKKTIAQQQLRSVLKKSTGWKYRLVMRMTYGLRYNVWK